MLVSGAVPEIAADMALAMVEEVGENEEVRTGKYEFENDDAIPCNTADEPTGVMSLRVCVCVCVCVCV